MPLIFPLSRLVSTLPYGANPALAFRSKKTVLSVDDNAERICSSWYRLLVLGFSNIADKKSVFHLLQRMFGDFNYRLRSSSLLEADLRPST